MEFIAWISLVEKQRKAQGNKFDKNKNKNKNKFDKTAANLKNLCR